MEEPAYVRHGLQTGFHPPEQCARGRADCRSLSQIVSDGAVTFMCCGEVAPGATPWPSDRWSFCHRSRADRTEVGGVDFRIFVDRRDMSHLAAVLSMGLAVAIPTDPELGATHD